MEHQPVTPPDRVLRLTWAMFLILRTFCLLQFDMSAFELQHVAFTVIDAATKQQKDCCE
jgi:hypothetical protein